MINQNKVKTQTIMQLIISISLVYNKQIKMDLLRQYVGGPKNRYKDDKFNLDLTYITPRLIAMAFPASGLQKLYRNSIDEVKNFLRKQHGSNYVIINLSGREVDETKLSNVLTYEWQDHQAPPIQMLFSVIESASQFLLANQNNVAVVHCNHGKGRTGTIICCLLLYGNIVHNSQIAMDFYAKKRFETQQGYGVTQPCQILYVQYFQKILRNPKIRPRIISLTKIIFRGQSKFDMLYVKIKNFNGKNILTTKKSESKTTFLKRKNTNNLNEIILSDLPEQYFWGDTKIFIKEPVAIHATAIATYSFNTAFLEGNSHIVPILELSPYSLRKTDNFGKDFEIQLQFKDGCLCPPQIQYSQKCNKCRERLMQEEEKWKKIGIVVEKRQKVDQRERQSMLGFHMKNNIRQATIKYQNQYEIQLQQKQKQKEEENGELNKHMKEQPEFINGKQ